MAQEKYDQGEKTKVQTPLKEIRAHG